MYISHFNYVKDNPKYRDQIVSISAYPPIYIKGKIETAPELAPDRDMLNKFQRGKIDYDTYFEAYWQKLEKLDMKIFDRLQGKILCCHCKEVLVCHRFWLSSFYHDKTGKFIPELGINLEEHLKEFERQNNLK